MSISAVSKGISLYILIVGGWIGFINLNNFVLTERQFTLFLVSFIFIIGFYIGFDAGKYSSMNGFILGLLAPSSILLVVSPYVEISWALNYMIIVVWVSLSIAGSMLGGFLKRTISKKESLFVQNTKLKTDKLN